MVNSATFNYIIAFLICVNTVLMAIDHYPINQGLDKILEEGNFYISMLFLIEMILKLLGLGILGYIRDGFNIFDGALVVISMVETFFKN